MNAASVLPWAAIIPGGIALFLGLLNMWKDWKTGEEGRQAESYAKRSEGAAKTAEATALEHRVWMEGSQGSIERLTQECHDCREEVARLQKSEARFQDGIYELFDDIDEQIAPMLMLSGQQQILDVLRAVMRKARNRIRPHPPSVPQ